jgi:hypothetical protein
MDHNTTFAAPGHVVSCEVADELVLLDTRAGQYFGLDPVGARVWTLVASGAAFGEVCDALYAEFDVARDQLTRDVAALMHDLTARQLIQPAG